jgi:hydroxymethylglutaryl-CoA lyase
MSFPKKVKIVEVSPRDGLQNEATFVPTAIKIDLVQQLAETGLSYIEATSFVSPKWVPQLADGRSVFLNIKKKPGVTYSALVPNLKGLLLALEVGVDEIAVFTTPSEEFSKHNTNCSVSQSLEKIAALLTCAKAENKRVRAYVSCVLGCPYEGEIAPIKVATLSKTLYQMGCDEISLGDTIGVGTPFKTQALLEMVAKDVPLAKLAVHFHDTYGQALANIYVALATGISIIDSSVAGLGGCPYANGATGNVATEDVVYMLNGMRIETGVDLEKLIKVGRFISSYLHKKPASKVNLSWGGLGAS